MSHWVTDAHSEVQRQAIVVRETGQPGVMPLWAGLGLLAVTAGMVILQLATHQLLLALLIALIGGITATLLSTSRSVSALFGGLLLVTALLVSLGVEVVYLADHLQGGDLFRMNTVFKFYIQVWILFSTGGAVAIYYIVFGSREKFLHAAEAEEKPGGTVPSQSDFGVGGVTATTQPTQPTFDAAEYSGNGVDYSYDADDAHEASRHEHPVNNWLVWSSDEIEEMGGVPAINETDVASLVGLLDDGTPLPAESEGETVSPPEFEADRQDPVMTTSQLPLPIEESGRGELWRPRWTPGRMAWSALFALFVLASLMFTVYGTQDRLRYRFPNPPPVGTLSGLRYMETAQYGTNVQGSAGAEVPLNVNLQVRL